MTNDRRAELDTKLCNLISITPIKDIQKISIPKGTGFLIGDNVTITKANNNSYYDDIHYDYEAKINDQTFDINQSVFDFIFKKYSDNEANRKYDTAMEVLEKAISAYK